MARLPEVTSRDAVPAEHLAAYDSIAASRGGVRGPFSMLMHSPVLAERTAHLGAYIRFESGLSPLDRELATLAVAFGLQCEYEATAHVPLAAAAGVSEQALEAIRERGSTAGLPAEQAQVIEFARELLHDHRVNDATFRAVRDRLGDQGTVELAATVGYYAMLACTLNACEVKPGP